MQLNRKILAFRLKVNRQTLALLGEVARLRAQARAGDPSWLQAEVATLAQEERRERQRSIAAMEALFSERTSFTLARVGLEGDAFGVTRSRSRPASRLVKHAAAVALALGAASFSACNGNGISEYDARPLEAAVDLRNERGISEYDARPLDAGAEAGVQTDGGPAEDALPADAPADGQGPDAE